MIDLIALAAVDRETEATYIRRERDWLERATAAGRVPDPARLLPVLPASIAAAATAATGPALGRHHERAAGNGSNGSNGDGAAGGHAPHG